jgi:hypothetical protein
MAGLYFLRRATGIGAAVFFKIKLAKGVGTEPALEASFDFDIVLVRMTR